MPAKNSVDPCEIVNTRIFEAPREHVYEAFANPDCFVRWWGPAGFTNTVAEFDVRPGNVLKYTMHSLDGADYANESRVVEATPPERIVLQHLELVHSFRMTMDFADAAGTTELTWRMRFDSAEECSKVREFCSAANEQNFNRLATELNVLAAERAAGRGDEGATAARQMVVKRLIRAPRQLVFDAFTQPEHLAQWWGPEGFTITTEKFDLRPGGMWKFIMHGPDGTDYHNMNRYEDVTPPERIVMLHGGSEEGSKSVDFRATITLVDHGDMTEVTLRSVFPTTEARDQCIRHYNAIEGGKQTLARLAALVERA